MDDSKRTTELPTTMKLTGFDPPQNQQEKPPSVAQSLQLRRATPTLCPVTGLAFFRAQTPADRKTTSRPSEGLFLLAGEDGWLTVYSVDDSRGHAASPVASRLYGRLRVFKEQAIQGCRVGNAGEEDSGDILVWGGRSVALVPRAQIQRLVDQGPANQGPTSQGASHDLYVEEEASSPLASEVQASDRIYDGLLPRTPGGVGALITAHNEVVPFRLVAAGAAFGSDAWSSTTLALVDPTISSSRPVLYSAQLAWFDEEEENSDSESDSHIPSRLLIAAGTVFGEIVVWTCQLPDEPANSHFDPQIEVRSVLTGHEGSIFGVALSPELDLSGLLRDRVPSAPARIEGSRARLLATCSDDRTVRIWPLYLDRPRCVGRDIASARTDGKKDGELPHMNEARETGFQNSFAGLSLHEDKETRIPEKQGADGAEQPAGVPSTALAVKMAHASRIWHVRFGAVTASDPRVMFVYSFGEDATVLEWRLELEVMFPLSSSPLQSLAGKLVQCRDVSCHAGKNIWATAVSLPTVSPGRRRQRVLVATGGCDGKICLFEGEQPRTVSSPTSTSFMISSSVPPYNKNCDARGRYGDAWVPPADEAAGEDVFNSYAFLSENTLLATTKHGRLLLGKLAENGGGAEASIWWEDHTNTRDGAENCLQDYSVVRSPREGGGGGAAARPGVDGLALIGCGNGDLFYFSPGYGVHRIPHAPNRKVDGIFFLPNASFSSPLSPLLPPSPSSPLQDTQIVQLEAVVTTLSADKAVIIFLAVDARGAVESEGAAELTLPRKAPSSPAAITVTAASKCLDYLILGSKSGQLCLYEETEYDNGKSTYNTFALVTCVQTDTRDAINSIVPLPPRPGQQGSSSFVATARDGTYRIYTIESNRNGGVGLQPPQIRLRHKTAPPFGPLVRGAWFIDNEETGGGSPELVLCGFRSDHFVVWNETRQQELATVYCTNGNRPHTYLFSPSRSGRLRFAFTQQSHLHVFGQESCTVSTVKAGGHGREIRAVRASASGTYVATGGEDTVVRIWSKGTLNTPDGQLRCRSVVKRHNTGLTGLAWLDDNYLVSAAGSEELFVWRVASILDSTYDGLAVMCVSGPLPDRDKDDKTLRIMGLDATKDPDEPTTALVSVALSNSTLKTYRYDLTAAAGGRLGGTWQLLAVGRYTGACPTQLRHLELRSPGDLVLLAAFTDGTISVWVASLQPNQAYNMLWATRVHRNAVKSLDISHPLRDHGRSEEDSLTWRAIITGGDDNAIAVTNVSWSNNVHDHAFSKTYRVSGGHAAAVTGIQFLAGAAGRGNLHDDDGAAIFTALSCGNDQRLKAWRISIAGSCENPTVRWQLLDDQYSAVADPGHLEVIGRRVQGASTMVVGMGMEAWRLV